MDFNVINEEFINTYDELSQLNEESQDLNAQRQPLVENRLQTIAELKRRAKQVKATIKSKETTSEEKEEAKQELINIRQQVEDQVTEFKLDLLKGFSLGSGGLLGILGIVAGLVGAAGPAFLAIISSAGCTAILSSIFSLLEYMRAKNLTNGKTNVKALIKQDPQLMKEIQQIAHKIGNTETEELLTTLEAQLAKHPEALNISKEELEASRNRFIQVIQQTSEKKVQSSQQQTQNPSKAPETNNLHEAMLVDDEDDAYSVNDFSTAEQNFCRQYLNDLPNISWLINNDELSFAVCLDELGYAKSFFDTTNAWDKDKEFDFAAKSLSTWKELMLKPVEKDLARLLPKLKQQIQTKGYDKPDEVYVVGARNIFLNGLCETLPHWKPEAEELHEAMLVDDEDEDYSVNDFSATEQNFCRQFLKDFKNLSWLIDNDELSFAICLDEIGYAKRVFSTTNTDDEEFGFAAKSLANWKNLMLKPIEDQLARQLPKLKQHIQDEGYDKPDEVYVTAARNLFLDGLSQTLPHWKD